MTHDVNLDGIPLEMRNRPAWVLWREEHKPGKSKIDKVPYMAQRPHVRAATNDARTWASFDVAVKALPAVNGHGGIGFNAGEKPDGWMLIDLDHCFPDGELAQWANDIVVYVNSYTETSPFGEGLHIIVRGDMQEPSIKTVAAEIYSFGRFFTVTGNVFNGRNTIRELSSDEIARIRAMIEATRPVKVQKTPAPAMPVAKVDGRLPEAMFRARNGEAIRQLWQGVAGEDKSAADMALCAHLAFWTKCDKAEMDRLFRQSGLMREKWDERHSGDGRTYGELTVDKAVEGCKAVHTGAPSIVAPQPTEPPPEERRVASVSNLSEFDDALVHLYHHGLDRGLSTGWVSIDRLFKIVKGMVYVVTGYPGSGKTEFVLDIAMHATTGYGWKWAVFSAENYPGELVTQNLLEKYLRKSFFLPGRMSFEEMTAAKQFVYDHYGALGIHDETVTVDSLLAASLTFPNDGLVVDPWNECEHCRGANQTQTEFIGASLTKIRRFARLHQKAVFICAHPAKMRRDKDGRFPVADLYDISDSAHWRNKADFGIVIYRNEVTDATDIYLKKCRFKYYGRVGVEAMRFDVPTGTFHDIEGAAPTGWADKTDF